MSNITNLPTGMIDLADTDISIRNYIFEKAKKVLSKRNVVQIETPVVELLSTVESLYGEEFNKLVFNLNDEGQKLILRYDLTVPMARFVGSNGMVKFRRFQYGKVYRRDHPQIEKGRYREFYQFDYDIIGSDQESGTNDLEMIETLCELLSEILGPNTFTIKINYKEVVIKILELCNIQEELFSVTFSALDKLDKKTFEEIKSELVQKGLNDVQILCLENIYLQINNNNAINNIDKISQFDKTFELLKINNLLTDKSEKYLSLVNIFISKMKLNMFVLDPFLIRGMDYYTGLLYEVTYNDKTIMESTISAGGRYDNMIGKFSNKGNIPAIGMSLGIERIVRILSKTIKFSNDNNIHVYVATIGKNMICDRVMLCSEIRKMGFNTIMSDLPNPSMRLQFDNVFDNNIPVMIIIGENEIKNKTLNIKDIKKNIQKTIMFDPTIIFDEINKIINNN